MPLMKQHEQQLEIEEHQKSIQNPPWGPRSGLGAAAAPPIGILLLLLSIHSLKFPLLPPFSH